MSYSFSQLWLTFILYHRCPTGVGKWASSFIQIPLIDLNNQDNNFHLDYIIVSLAIILLPIQSREKFLEQVRNIAFFEVYNITTYNIHA